VHRRLQLYFSGNYGLDIASRPGCSRVTMTLPAVGLQFREGVAGL
jgi:sensor histidine kinase YesM